MIRIPTSIGFRLSDCLEVWASDKERLTCEASPSIPDDATTRMTTKRDFFLMTTLTFALRRRSSESTRHSVTAFLPPTNDTLFLDVRKAVGDNGDTRSYELWGGAL